MINTVVINDDIHSLKKIKRMILQKKELKLINDYKDPIRFLEEFKKSKKEIKVIFLGTNIMGYSSLEIAKNIHQIDNKIKIIFISSNQDYAVEAFEINIFDYLIWPIEEKRFYKTINRLEETEEI